MQRQRRRAQVGGETGRCGPQMGLQCVSVKLWTTWALLEVNLPPMQVGGVNIGVHKEGHADGSRCDSVYIYIYEFLPAREAGPQLRRKNRNFPMPKCIIFFEI